MKRVIILLFINSYLFSNTISFNEVREKALKESYLLQDITENIRLDEIRLSELTYPGLLNLSGSISPTWNITKNSSDFEFGNVSLGLSPYHNIDISTSFGKDYGSFGISYTPLKSKRDIIKAKNDIEINRVRYREIYRDTLKDLKRKYNNLYYLREMIELKKVEIGIQKQEVVNLENRTNLGLGNQIELNRLYLDINSYESDLFEMELELLKADKELSTLTGLDLSQYTLEAVNPMDPTGDIIIKTIDELTGSSEYLAIEDSIRDKKVALKESKLDIVPDISFLGGVSTTDYKDFIGTIGIQGSFNLNLGYKRTIEAYEIELKKIERERELKLSEYKNSYEYSLREADLRLKRINILKINLENQLKRVEVAQFKEKRGEVLSIEVEKAMVQKSITELQLNHELVNFTIEYLEDRDSEQLPLQ